MLVVDKKLFLNFDIYENGLCCWKNKFFARKNTFLMKDLGLYKIYFFSNKRILKYF